MLKISVVEGPHRRRMIVEGALIAPWTDELADGCKKAGTELEDRELIVDVRGLTAISSDGAMLLLQFVRDKTKLRSGVYVRELLRQLIRDAR